MVGRGDNLCVGECVRVCVCVHTRMRTCVFCICVRVAVCVSRRDRGVRKKKQNLVAQRGILQGTCPFIVSMCYL